MSKISFPAVWWQNGQKAWKLFKSCHVLEGKLNFCCCRWIKYLVLRVWTFGVHILDAMSSMSADKLKVYTILKRSYLCKLWTNLLSFVSVNFISVIYDVMLLTKLVLNSKIPLLYLFYNIWSVLNIDWWANNNTHKF